MTCIDRYLAVTLLKGWALALAILLAVFSLFVLVAELDHVDSQYRVMDAMRFTFLTMPKRALDLSPAISLLGTLGALATLSKHNELVAIRSTGMTLARLARSVAIPAAGLAILLACLSEYIAAPLYHAAEMQRSITRSDSVNLLSRGGLWSTDGMRFLNVQTLHPGHVPQDIELYEFTPDGRLNSFIHADHAEVNPGSRKWHLVNVRQKILLDGEMVTRHLPRLDMGPFWSSSELPVLPFSPDGMSLRGTREYLQHLQETGQRSAHIERLFWQKATVPLAAGIMVLLATPLGADSDPRNRTATGRRIATGGVIGILFYFGTQVIHAAGSLLELDPALTALTPILILLAASAFLYYRMNW